VAEIEEIWVVLWYRHFVAGCGCKKVGSCAKGLTKNRASVFFLTTRYGADCWQGLRPVFNNISWPTGVQFPLGVNLAPRGELCSLGEMFTPLFPAQGEQRGEQRVFWGIALSLGANFTPGGHILPLGAKLMTGLWVRLRFRSWNSTKQMARWLRAYCLHSPKKLQM
jgi:hypothetical protein